MLKKIVIHPFLIALFPVVSLWASNVDYVKATLVLRSLVLAVILAGVLFLLAHWATREWVKAGVITSLILLAILSYGHFYTVLKGVAILNPMIRHRYLVPLVGVLLGFMLVLVVKNAKILPSVSMFLTVMGAVLLGLSLAKIILFEINTYTSSYETPQVSVETSSSASTDTPDIYYIILDAYGREDILKDLYKYDNSEFVQALEQRGFYVADKSNTNYMQTLISLSSSLNMNYLDEYISQNGGKQSVPFLVGLINNNQLYRTLRAQGYKVVAFQTTFVDSSKADVFLKPPAQRNLAARSLLSLNEFEGMLLDTTIGKAWLDTFYNEQQTSAISTLRLPYLQHRNDVIYTLTDLGNVAKMPGKKFVFAHVLSPHPPFVFTHSGDFVYPLRPYSTGDGNDFKGGPDDYIAGYTEQIQYINKLVLNAVDAILANSSKPPIIIIQGDHGPGAYLHWGSLEHSNVKERMGMLNAYYFPDKDYAALYPSISPVNSFRVVLDKFFGANLELLPDNHYFSTDFEYGVDDWTVNFRKVNDIVGK